MAKVYAPPSSVGDPPDFEDFKIDNEYDFNAHLKAEEAWIEEVSAAARAANPTNDLAGEVIRFQIADGYAVYVIWDSRSIIHCAVGDNWSIPEAHARGLQAADLRDLVKREKSMRELFGTSKHEMKK